MREEREVIRVSVYNRRARLQPFAYLARASPLSRYTKRDRERVSDREAETETQRPHEYTVLSIYIRAPMCIGSLCKSGRFERGYSQLLSRAHGPGDRILLSLFLPSSHPLVGSTVFNEPIPIFRLHDWSHHHRHHRLGFPAPFFSRSSVSSPVQSAARLQRPNSFVIIEISSAPLSPRRPP